VLREWSQRCGPHRATLGVGRNSLSAKRRK
jgi:hypothetical protein